MLPAGTQLNGVVTYHICPDEEQDPSLKGGQGQVYKAYNKRPDGKGGRQRDQVFAVKRPVDPQKQSGQQREGQVYFNINPEEASHLAFLSDVVRHNNVPLLVMEWADKSLKDWLSEQPKLILPQLEVPMLKRTLEHGIQIVLGLISLHELQMVHQDLKPGEKHE